VCVLCSSNFDIIVEDWQSIVLIIVCSANSRIFSFYLFFSFYSWCSLTMCRLKFRLVHDLIVWERSATIRARNRETTAIVEEGKKSP